MLNELIYAFGLVLLFSTTLIVIKSRRNQIEETAIPQVKSHPWVGRKIRINFAEENVGVIYRVVREGDSVMNMVSEDGRHVSDDTLIFWANFPPQKVDDVGYARGLTRESFDFV